jgi:hypothetical protein
MQVAVVAFHTMLETILELAVRVVAATVEVGMAAQLLMQQ